MVYCLSQLHQDQPIRSHNRGASSVLSPQGLCVCPDQIGLKGVSTGQNSTSTLDLVSALAALNISNHYECEINSTCERNQNFNVVYEWLFIVYS